MDSVERLTGKRTNQALNASRFAKQLLQSGVLSLGLLQDGDVGVGVFPESEGILVGRAGSGRVTVESFITGQSHKGQDKNWIVF